MVAQTEKRNYSKNDEENDAGCHCYWNVYLDEKEISKNDGRCSYSCQITMHGNAVYYDIGKEL